MVYGYFLVMQFKSELFKYNNLNPYKKHTNCIYVKIHVIRKKIFKLS